MLYFELFRETQMVSKSYEEERSMIDK